VESLLDSNAALPRNFTIILPNLLFSPESSVGYPRKRKQIALIFADIVDSTELVARLGDDHWLGLLSSFFMVVRREVAEFHGWYLSTAGDGLIIVSTLFAVAMRFRQEWLPLDFEFGWECMAANASPQRISWLDSHCTSAHESQRLRQPVRCWCQIMSRLNLQAVRLNSLTAALTI